MYCGEGKLSQLSGTSYDGLWINGRPAHMAVKLVITGLEDTSRLLVACGDSFSVSVECHTDNDELMQGTLSAVQCIHAVLQPVARYQLRYTVMYCLLPRQ